MPFAIFSEMRPTATYLRGLKYPADVFTYEPPKRAGLPASSQRPRKWIGLFQHWQPHANPLSTLAPVCHVLTAAEIFDATGSQPWLRERMASVEAAAKFLLGRRGPNGLIGGSGFYTESPPALRLGRRHPVLHRACLPRAVRLCGATGDRTGQSAWSGPADRLAEAFGSAFWRGDHFGEYIHPEHGLIDSHGLSDVNWAAVAFDLADGRALQRLWPRPMKEPEFWFGGMPTQPVSKPFTYEKWEYPEPLSWHIDPLKDIAAMGRVWYLEGLACRRMKEHGRLLEGARRVCQAGLKTGGYWRERYYPHADGTVAADGAMKYCEYPAILVRTVFGNRETFWRT